MLRTLTAIGAILGVLATASLAEAQTHDFGTRGEFIVSADRLVPFFSYTRMDEHALPPLPADETGASTTSTQTNLSFLWGSAPPQNGSQELFFTVPRIGFDYVVAPNVTIGGDLAVYFTLGSGTSTETEAANGTTTTVSGGNGGMFLFGFAPRAGYVVRVNHLASFWLRGGVSYYTETQNSPKAANGSFTHAGADEFALDLDPQVVLTPIPHFGVTAGLTTDIPLAGEHWQKNFDGGTTTEASAGSSLLFFGVTVGLLGYF